MNRSSNDNEIRELKRIFESDGVRAALIFLNSLTDLRFTSFYQFHDQTLHSINFFDREQPSALMSMDVPITASYCVFVRDSGTQFITHEARLDERLKGHPKQHALQSYCGVPVTNQKGKLFGTICHYDLKVGKISNLDVELLGCLAKLLQSQIP